MITDSLQDVSGALLKFLNTPRKRYTIDDYMDPLRELGFDDETIYATVRQLRRDGLVEETGENGYYLELTSAGAEIANAANRTSLGETMTEEGDLAAGVAGFLKDLKDLQRATITTEPELESAEKRLEQIKHDGATYIDEHAPSDIAKLLSPLVKRENRYRTIGNHPFHQRKGTLQGRVAERIETFAHVIALISISDPILEDRSLSDERAELTVEAKASLLLQKLYALRKIEGYHPTNLIFSLNQVALDGYEDARGVVKFLESRGLVKVFPASEGLDAQISTDGKVLVEQQRVQARAQVETPSQQGVTVDQFVHESRITELEQLTHPDLDFRKLIQYCKELNDNYRGGNYLSVPMLGRSILDHVPPVFGCTTFDQVVGNYGGKSFKKSMDHLNKSLRSIADSYLHLQIRKTESLPNAIQVNFSQDMDVLLAEVVRKAQEG